MTRLIKNEQEYEKALSRIEELMGAEPDTDEMEELNLLTSLVESYEDRHYPISLPRRADAAKFRIDQPGIRCEALIP